MWKLLSFLQKNLIWTIPAMMILGIVSGYFFDLSFMKVTVIPLTFLMVYPMMVNLQIEKVFSLEGIKCQIVTQIINFGIIPFIAFGLANYFFPNSPMIVLGLLFASLLPTSGMTISWTGFAKGNMNAAIKMTVVGLIIGSIATPFYAKWLMGEVIEMPMQKIFISIIVVVFLPMIFGYITKISIIKFFGEKRYNSNIKQKFPMLSTLGVLGIVFVAMCLKAKSITADPTIIINCLIPLILLYLINFIISTFVGKLFFNRGDGIALVYGTVMRNLSIALAIAMTAFTERGSEIAIIIAMAYIIQVQSAAWYVKFTDKIFGELKESKSEKGKKDILPVPAKEKMDVESKVTGSVIININKILFATDLSETARFAVKYACSIGNQYNAKVYTIHVVPDVLEEYSSGVGINLAHHINKKKWDEFNQKNIDTAKKLMIERMEVTSQQILKEISHCPLSTSRTIVAVGNPVDTIVKTAQEGGFDMIIMGTHGHGKFEEMMIGSTATGVILKSSVPVLIAKPVS